MAESIATISEKNIRNLSGCDISALSRSSGIRENVLHEICGLAEQYHIDKVILFGSRARGDYRKTSDIDLAACGGDFTLFALDVDEKTDTLLKYDIVDLNRPMNSELLESIEKEGICFYARSTASLTVL